jgi:hypothetical protein
MIRSLSMAAALLALPAVAAAQTADQPRRNIRLGAAIGQGFISPPLCSRCDRFWGRGLSFAVEVGWTVRPDLVLALEEQGTVIYFADGTDGGLASIQLSALYFWRPRAFLRGGFGFGIVDVAEDQHPLPGAALWEHFGPGLMLGVGYDWHRSRALSVSLEARTTFVITRNSLAPGLALLMGLSWN